MSPTTLRILRCYKWAGRLPGMTNTYGGRGFGSAGFPMRVIRNAQARGDRPAVFDLVAWDVR